MIRIFAMAVVATLLGAAPARAVTDAEKAALQKAYEGGAAAFAAADFDKTWSYIDQNCVFIDSKGRHTAAEVRPQSKELYANIRNGVSTYTVHSIKNKNGKLIVFIEEESHFQLRSKGLFSESWNTFTRKSASIDTWQRKGNAWKLIETKTLREEVSPDLEEVLGALGGATGGKVGKAFKTAQQSVCAVKCTESLMKCAEGANDARTTLGCASEHRNCLGGCKQ